MNLTPRFIALINQLRKSIPDFMMALYILRILCCLRMCGNEILKSPLLAIVTIFKILLILPHNENQSANDEREMHTLIRSLQAREKQIDKLLSKLERND